MATKKQMNHATKELEALHSLKFYKNKKKWKLGNEVIVPVQSISFGPPTADNDKKLNETVDKGMVPQLGQESPMKDAPRHNTQVNEIQPPEPTSSDLSPQNDETSHQTSPSPQLYEDVFTSKRPCSPSDNEFDVFYNERPQSLGNSLSTEELDSKRPGSLPYNEFYRDVFENQRPQSSPDNQMYSENQRPQSSPVNEFCGDGFDCQKPGSPAGNQFDNNLENSKEPSQQPVQQKWGFDYQSLHHELTLLKKQAGHFRSKDLPLDSKSSLTGSNQGDPVDLQLLLKASAFGMWPKQPQNPGLSANTSDGQLKTGDAEENDQNKVSSSVERPNIVETKIVQEVMKSDTTSHLEYQDPNTWNSKDIHPPRPAICFQENNTQPFQNTDLPDMTPNNSQLHETAKYWRNSGQFYHEGAKEPCAIRPQSLPPSGIVHQGVTLENHSRNYGISMQQLQRDMGLLEIGKDSSQALANHEAPYKQYWQPNQIWNNTKGWKHKGFVPEGYSDGNGNCDPQNSPAQPHAPIQRQCLQSELSPALLARAAALCAQGKSVFELQEGWREDQDWNERGNVPEGFSAGNGNSDPLSSPAQPHTPIQWQCGQSELSPALLARAAALCAQGKSVFELEEGWRGDQTCSWCVHCSRLECPPESPASMSPARLSASIRRASLRLQDLLCEQLLRKQLRAQQSRRESNPGLSHEEPPVHQHSKPPPTRIINIVGGRPYRLKRESAD